MLAVSLASSHRHPLSARPQRNRETRSLAIVPVTAHRENHGHYPSAVGPNGTAHPFSLSEEVIVSISLHEPEIGTRSSEIRIFGGRARATVPGRPHPNGALQLTRCARS